MELLPIITTCEADACAYNRDRTCHAGAITVGDTVRPHCDTFVEVEAKGGTTRPGRVGACKVAGCRHNRDLECQAEGITVGYVKNEVDCLTYAPA